MNSSTNTWVKYVMWLNWAFIAWLVVQIQQQRYHGHSKINIELHCCDLISAYSKYIMGKSVPCAQPGHTDVTYLFLWLLFAWWTSAATSSCHVKKLWHHPLQKYTLCDNYSGDIISLSNLHKKYNFVCGILFSCQKYLWWVTHKWEMNSSQSRQYYNNKIAVMYWLITQ